MAANKILSVCIPSYNMEQYLSRNIESFVAATEILDKLELIIVNDGSKDQTLEIANNFKAKYPGSVVVIDKPNGHYGSCINASLQIATGKYFRIVDADDWVDTNALVTVVKELEHVDADMVYTQYSTYHEDDGKTYLEEDAADFTWNQVLSLNEVKFDKYLHMHQVSYRLELLNRINYRQTEGVCYTDTEYDFIPCVNSKTIFCIPVSLYQYYVGRGDQSMAPEVIARNFMDLYKVLLSIVDYPKPKDANNNFTFLHDCYINCLYGYIVDALFAKRCANKEWNYLFREITHKLDSQSFNLTEFKNRKIWGCPWVMWVLADDAFSNSKIKILFKILKLRFSS